MGRAQPRLQLSENEFARRRHRLTQRLAEHGLEGLVLFLAHNVSYMSRFGFMTTERPIAYVFTPHRSVLFVPRLETEHAERMALVDRVVTYPEYPDTRHPLQYFADVLRELGLERGALGFDAPAAPKVFGYRGPTLAELLPEARLRDMLDELEHIQMIKSPEELELITVSARWGGRAHELLQQYCRVGVGEVELSMQASFDATREMLETLGDDYTPMSWEKAGAVATFHGQVGPNSALPHVLTANATLQPGDNLITFADAAVAGYRNELERTLIVGEPSASQEKFFGLMLEAQTIAMNAIAPGATCADVDAEVRAFYIDNDLMPYWRHHTGHGIGRLLHEAPFFDVGDARVLEPGMVMTVEPGLYVPGLGGFRHSDTVVVTDNGVRSITTYPRDLESLIIPV